MKLLKSILILLMVLNIQSTFAASKRGTESGGGGDSAEMRVNEIRADILSWINNGGARGLQLPSDITLNEYEEKMKDILRPQYVVVGFIEQDNKDDVELQLTVYGTPKTCRGFISSKDNRPHILCNINRFNTISASDQYRLIHHEYAGLVNVENNDQAASDYIISSQLSDFLQSQRVYKLSVGNIKGTKLSKECINDLNKIIKNKKNTLKRIQSGEITSETSEFLLKGWDNVAEVTAITCAGLKKLELEKSFKARTGFLSQDEVEEIINQVNEDAIKYYYKYSS